MADTRIDRQADPRTGTHVRLRPGGGQYPDYELGKPSGESRYGRYESGRGVNYYEADPNLAFVLEGHLDAGTLAWAQERLDTLGEHSGHEIVHRADITDEMNHDLVRYDRFGREVSEVRCHPNWTANLNEVFDFGLVGWNHDEDLLARYGRAPAPLLAAFDYVVGQAEASLCCPVELAHGTVMVLEKFADAGLRERFLPSVVSTDAAARMQVAQVATEISGGSDVGSTRSVARLDGDRWSLSGEKWFASNVNADLIVTLARPDASVSGTRGLAMFVVPRVREDGEPNGTSIRRLKDKMGTIGVPTGELIFTDAEAYLVGDPSEGFKYMAEMLNHTRFWNSVGSLGIMRRSYLEAAVYAARRKSFGASIDSFPMVRESLAWLTVDLEATMAVVFEAAAVLEEHEVSGDEEAYLHFRTLAPLTKYRAGEQCVASSRTAIETLGGNGAIRDFGVERLLRDAMVNVIWEGTSNICSLDLWRAITKQGGHEPVLNRVEYLVSGVKTNAAGRLAETTTRCAGDLQDAISALANAGEARQMQQARRLADLFGDVVALAALTGEAERAAAGGDYRKALVGELFAMRLTSPQTPLSALTDDFRGVPEVYEALVAEDGCPEEDYRSYLRTLGRD